MREETRLRAVKLVHTVVWAFFASKGISGSRYVLGIICTLLAWFIPRAG